jgi:hypothetical protein
MRKHGVGFSERGVQLHRLNVQDLFAAERKELASDGCRFRGALLKILSGAPKNAHKRRGNH